MTLPWLAPLSAAGEIAFFDPFALHARLDFDFNDRDSYPMNFPVLVHEYTHYLQSVSTVYGLLRVLDWIRTGVRLASVLPRMSSIRIPLLRSWKSRSCPAALRAQMEVIADRMDLNHDLEQPDSLQITPDIAFGPLQIGTVRFSDGEQRMAALVRMSEKVSIPIGARALAEGMSASVQRIWEVEPRVDGVLARLDPAVSGWYTATRMLLGEIIGSDRDLDYINAFVCDIAMMTRNPLSSFVMAAMVMITSGAKTKEDVVSVVREALRELVTQETEETRVEIAEMLSRLAESTESFGRAMRRLLTSSDELLVRRSAEPGFPVHTLFNRELGSMQTLLQQYPLPSYFYGGKFMSWHGDEDLARLGEDLLMMEHAMRILLYGPDTGAACPLTESSTCGAPKTILCGAAPWQINVDADGMICAFGAAMATFGTLGKIIE